MDLATRIRTELSEGKPSEQIVADLVASGMSPPTAQKLVDRAIATPVPPPAETDDDEEPKTDPGGRFALVRGALFFSLGVTITFVTYTLAKPGEEYVITWGFVVAGLAVFTKLDAR